MHCSERENLVCYFHLQDLLKIIEFTSTGYLILNTEVMYLLDVNL
jgi:hypothetical protein